MFMLFFYDVKIEAEMNLTAIMSDLCFGLEDYYALFCEQLICYLFNQTYFIFSLPIATSVFIRVWRIIIDVPNVTMLWIILTICILISWVSLWNDFIF